MLLCVECEVSDAIDRALLVFLSTHTAQYSLNTEHELFHGERFGDVVVSTYLESLEDILFQLLGGEENDRHVSISLSDFLCESETVFLRHHDIKDADIILLLHESAVSGFAIRIEFSTEAFSLKVLTEKHAEVLIVLA